jgi:hypothetical protein
MKNLFYLVLLTTMVCLSVVGVEGESPPVEPPPPPTECPIKGQKYFECAPCPATCEEPNPICPKICKPGCACPEGKVLKNGKECVKPEKCPKECDIEGQRYYKCAPCPATCEEPNPVCTKICEPGCGCPKGKVLKNGEECVIPKKCQDVEECDIKGQKYYKGCAPCTGTCEDPNPVCPEICKPGCACRKGRVVRNGEECVSPKKCPKGCEEGGKTYKDGET